MVYLKILQIGSINRRKIDTTCYIIYSTQISLITYKDTAEVQFELNTFLKGAHPIQESMVFIRSEGSTDIASAVEKYMFSATEAAGNRDDVGDVLVILTDGGPDLSVEDYEFIQAVRYLNPTLKAYVIGFGNNAMGHATRVVEAFGQDPESTEQVGHVTADEDVVGVVEGVVCWLCNQMDVHDTRSPQRVVVEEDP